ncbi:MAG TPA: hypothetical protein PKX78_01060 [Candidatus Woesebacteria bacterium]|nr:hypothetical protein [Candidatus Woesebacteria bacterium]
MFTAKTNTGFSALGFLSKQLIVLLVFSVSWIFFSNSFPVFAATCNKLSITYSGQASYVQGSNNSFTVSISNKSPSDPVIVDGTDYKLIAFYTRLASGFRRDEITVVRSNRGNITYTINESAFPRLFEKETTIAVSGGNLGSGWCEIAKYKIVPAIVDYLYVYQNRNGQRCYGGNGGGCLESSDSIPINVESRVVNGNGNPLASVSVKHQVSSNGIPTTTDGNGVAVTSHRGIVTRSGILFPPDVYSVDLVFISANGNSTKIGSTKFSISQDCSTHSNSCQTTASNLFTGTNNQGTPYSEYKICDQIPESLSDQRQSCLDCVGSEDGYGGIWTAIGCIPNDPETIVSVFLRFGLGMGGGVALLMILGAGFMLTVSQGDPKQTDTAKQWLTSAIAGLLFIIFSVTILQFIGYNVFQIPGFGG